MKILNHNLVINDKCNMSCKYCYVKNKCNNSIEIHTAQKIIDFAIINSDATLNINFVSTEPLMDFEKVKEIISYAKKNSGNKKIHFSLNTNGLLIDKEKCAFLKENNVRTFISYDSKKTHGTSYENLMKNIECAFNIGLDFGLISTITKENFSEWKEIIDVHARFKRDTVHIRRAVSFDNQNGLYLNYNEYLRFWKRYLRYILDLNKKGILIKDLFLLSLISKILKLNNVYSSISPRCSAFKTHLTYDIKGNIIPCDEARQFNDHFKMGSVFDKDIKPTDSFSLNYNCKKCELSWCGECPVYTKCHERNIKMMIDRCMFYKRANKFAKDLLNSENSKILLSWLV